MNCVCGHVCPGVRPVLQKHRPRTDKQFLIVPQTSEGPENEPRRREREMISRSRCRNIARAWVISEGIAEYTRRMDDVAANQRRYGLPPDLKLLTDATDFMLHGAFRRRPIRHTKPGKEAGEAGFRWIVETAPTACTQVDVGMHCECCC